MIFRQDRKIMRRQVESKEAVIAGGVAISGVNGGVLISSEGRNQHVGTDELPFLYRHGHNILICEGPDNNGLLRFGPSLLTGSMTMIESLFWTAVYAGTDDPLLILGESGTGKEEFSRFAHHLSGRKGPFVAVNLGGMPVELAESELFGHQKGAFTGAAFARKGLFEAAKHGTIFLDEIGDTPLSLQTKLLRVVETGEFRVLGSSMPVKTDCRVIAATNRDLRSMAEAGSFRFDLYQRLSPLSVSLPPLRLRKLDIKGLVKSFAAHKGTNLNIGEDALAVLLRHSWKGNVRELAAFVTRLVLIAGHEGPGLGDVKLALSGGYVTDLAPAEFRDPADMAIYDAFTRNQTGKVVYSALGMSKSTYYERLKKIRVGMVEN